MIFIAYSPDSGKEVEVYASRISEAAIILSSRMFGDGWGKIRVFETSDGRSAIIVAPNKRPFKIDAM